MTQDVLNGTRQRIRWQMRRGLLELDIVFARFMADGFDSLSSEELRVLEDILRWNDQDLLQAVNGSKTVDNALQAALIEKIRTSGTI